MRMIVKGRAELERAVGLAQGGDIIDVLHDEAPAPEANAFVATAERRPVKKRAPRAIEAVPERRVSERRMGRPPKPWFCTGCSTDTTGRICGGCGAPRP